jgi:hypothetical protein
VEKTKISLLGGLRLVTTMLLVHWIGDWGAAVGLPTVTRDGGGDRVTGDDRSRRDQVNCACANARARVLGASGMLGIQKRMCPCASRSWRLGGARGDRGEARAEAMRRGGRKGGPARGREGGDKAG